MAETNVIENKRSVIKTITDINRTLQYLEDGEVFRVGSTTISRTGSTIEVEGLSSESYKSFRIGVPDSGSADFIVKSDQGDQSLGEYLTAQNSIKPISDNLSRALTAIRVDADKYKITKSGHLPSGQDAERTIDDARREFSPIPQVSDGGLLTVRPSAYFRDTTDYTQLRAEFNRVARLQRRQSESKAAISNVEIENLSGLEFSIDSSGDVSLHNTSNNPVNGIFFTTSYSGEKSRTRTTKISDLQANESVKLTPEQIELIVYDRYKESGNLTNLEKVVINASID